MNARTSAPGGRSTITPTIGWVGIGAIGWPMARRVVDGGLPLAFCGHHERLPIEDLLAAGATEAATPAELARNCSIVVTMVRDEPQTDEVIFGADGVLAGARPGTTLVIMSTLSPTYCQRVAYAAHPLGMDVVDAPVSGGVPSAQQGTLTIMVGGSTHALGTARPLLELLGTDIFEVGPIGAGQIAKIVNNAVKAAVLAATTEGLDMGVSAGLDLDALLAVLRRGTARSHVVENWDYYDGHKKQHRPGGPLEILNKDMALALDLARDHHVEVPIMAATASSDVGRRVRNDSHETRPHL